MVVHVKKSGRQREREKRKLWLNKLNMKEAGPDLFVEGTLKGALRGCFLFLLFWGTPKDMDLRNAYV